MNRLRIAALGLSLGLSLASNPANAQDGEPAAEAVDAQVGVISQDAELRIGINARELYSDATFDAIMDLVENSRSYQEQAGHLAAWGFDPRADVHEFVFAVDRFGAADAEFVMVASGDLSADEMTRRLNEQEGLTANEGPLGRQWTDARGTSFVVTDRVAISGVGDMLAHTPLATHGTGELDEAAVLAGGANASDGAPSTVWLQLQVSDAVRAQHPALQSLRSLLAMLEVDATPALRIRAELVDAADAEQAAAELRHLFTVLGDVPEVEALHIEGLVRDAVVEVDGTHLRMDTEIDTATWSRFSRMLSDLVEEELR